MFLKELEIYISYFLKKLEDTELTLTSKQMEYFEEFQKNLNDGINYYRKLFSETLINPGEKKEVLLKGLKHLQSKLNTILIPQMVSW